MKRTYLWLGLAVVLTVGVFLTGRPPFNDSAKETIFALPPAILLWTVVAAICACFLIGLALEAMKSRENDDV